MSEKTTLTRLSRKQVEAQVKRRIPQRRATTDAEIARQIAGDPDTAPDITTLPDSWRREVRTLRERLRMTQRELANLLQISVATLRNWEQGRTLPDGAAGTLLRLLSRSPRTIVALLKS